MYKKSKNQILKILTILNNSSENKDFRWCFISSIWMSIIKADADRNNRDIKKYIYDSPVKSFLTNEWFFDSTERCILSKKVLPILSIGEESDVEKHSNSFWKILDSHLTCKKEFIWNLKRIIWELLQNIFDHSWFQNSVIYNYSSWQFYNKPKVLQISVVDCWKWIFSSLTRRYPEIKNSWEAIIEALKPEISWWRILTSDCDITNYQTYNKWLWLSTTKAIIENLWWELFIWSRDYLYCYSKENKVEMIKLPEVNKWIWTFVIINIPVKDKKVINIDDINNELLWKDKVFDKKIKLNKMFT